MCSISVHADDKHLRSCRTTTVKGSHIWVWSRAWLINVHIGEQHPPISWWRNAIIRSQMWLRTMVRPVWMSCVMDRGVLCRCRLVSRHTPAYKPPWALPHRPGAAVKSQVEYCSYSKAFHPHSVEKHAATCCENGWWVPLHPLGTSELSVSMLVIKTRGLIPSREAISGFGELGSTGNTGCGHARYGVTKTL